MTNKRSNGSNRSNTIASIVDDPIVKEENIVPLGANFAQIVA